MQERDDPIYDDNTKKTNGGNNEHNDIAVLICENVYLHKVLDHTLSKNKRLHEQLKILQNSLQIIHVQSYKNSQPEGNVVKKLSQQLDKLLLLESELNREIQTRKEKEQDTIWLQTHIEYLKEENRISRLSLGNNSKLNLQIKTLRQDHTNIFNKKDELEELLIMRDEKIASLEMETKSKDQEIESLKKELDRENEFTRKSQSVIREKDDHNKRLVDLCNKLEHNRTQMMRMQEVQEEDRMNVEQELAKAQMKLNQVSSETNLIVSEKDNEISLLQQQIDMYQEKINLLESRLHLQEQAKLETRPRSTLESKPSTQLAKLIEKNRSSIGIKKSYTASLKKI